MIATYGDKLGREHLERLLIIMEHPIYRRLSYPALRDRVVAMRKRWRADAVLIEDASSGAHLWADLRLADGFRPIMIKPLADKVTRMVGQLALIEDGELLIPDEAPWLDAFIGEARAFPASRYMDQIDALAQFLEWSKYRDEWARLIWKNGRRSLLPHPRRPDPRQRRRARPQSYC